MAIFTHKKKTELYMTDEKGKITRKKIVPEFVNDATWHHCAKFNVYYIFGIPVFKIQKYS